MGVIESKREHKTARIRFDDGYRIMIFFDYKDGKYLGIRLWRIIGFMRIPVKLIWSMSMQETRMLQGWFSKDGDLMELICKNIAEKNKFQEMKAYLIHLEETLDLIGRLRKNE